MKNIIIIIIGLTILACVGICIYFVGNISAVAPPIMTYEITNSSAKQMVDNIQSLKNSNSNLKFQIIDTIGDKSIGLGYEIITNYNSNKDTLEYHLKCVEDKIDGLRSKITLQLIGAHDFTKRIGGYGKDAKGMDILLLKFDSLIINPLIRKGLILKPQLL